MPPAQPSPVDGIDLDDRRAVRRFRPRTVGFVLAMAAWGGVFVYDFWFASGDTFAFWDVRRLDWLFVAANLVVAYTVVVPALQRPGLTRARLAELWRDRGAAAALAFLTAFYVLTLVGPPLLGRPDLNLAHANQPPVFQAVPATAVQSCAGHAAEGWCHGSLQYPFGTDGDGRGVLRLVVEAQRVAFLVALVASALIVPLAVAVGVTAATLGGRVDDALMRYVDVQQAVPAVLVYLILAFYFRKTVFMFVLVFGLLNWGGVARVVRSDVLARTDAGYVKAARSAGASRLQVATRHLLPNASPTLVTAVTRQIPMLILFQVALAFIDLNQPLLVSYGNIISGGSFESLADGGVFYWWTDLVPLAALATTVAAFSVLGDSIRDVLDPRTAADA